MGERTIIDDIEDNYPDYLDHALGYRWDTWDKTTQAERVRHDRFLRADAFDGDLAALAPLDQWAVFRASRRREETELSLECARLLLGSPRENDLLEMSEIFAVTIEALAKSERFDEALLHLETLKTNFPDYEESDLIAFEVYLAHDPDAAESTFAALTERRRSNGDIEAEVDAIFFLLDREHDDYAKRVFDQIGSVASTHAAYVDLTLLADEHGWKLS